MEIIKQLEFKKFEYNDLVPGITGEKVGLIADDIELILPRS